MNRTNAQTARKFRRESRAIALLAVAGVALVGTFNIIPPALLSGSYHRYHDWATLQTALASALSTLWRERASSLPPELARLVDYWFLWHAIKIVICLAAVSVFTPLGVALWDRYITATQRAALWRCGATVATIGAAFATVVLVLNVQATAVPLVALLPALPAASQTRASPTPQTKSGPRRPIGRTRTARRLPFPCSFVRWSATTGSWPRCRLCWPWR